MLGRPRLGLRALHLLPVLPLVLGAKVTGVSVPVRFSLPAVVWVRHEHSEFIGQRSAAPRPVTNDGQAGNHPGQSTLSPLPVQLGIYARRSWDGPGCGPGQKGLIKS